MSVIKSKIAPSQSLKKLGEDIVEYAKTKGTKEDIAFFLQELDEMEKIIKDGLKKHEK